MYILSALLLHLMYTYGIDLMPAVFLEEEYGMTTYMARWLDLNGLL